MWLMLWSCSDLGVGAWGTLSRRQEQQVSTELREPGDESSSHAEPIR